MQRLFALPRDVSPVVDREVRSGTGLQVLLGSTCLISALASRLSEHTHSTSAPLSLDDFAASVLWVPYPVASILACIGSGSRSPARRRSFYGIYLGWFALAATVPVVAVPVRPTAFTDPDLARWGLPLGVIVGNPAALWIVGRWLIFLLFPSMRPIPPQLPRGFDVVMGPGDDWPETRKVE